MAGRKCILFACFSRLMALEIGQINAKYFLKENITATGVMLSGSFLTSLDSALKTVSFILGDHSTELV